MKRILFALSLFLCLNAQANSIADWVRLHGGYVGFGVGHGSTVATNQPVYQNIDVNRQQDSTGAAAFMGLRKGLVGVETGFMYLPQYHATASTQDYPAYKGCVAGPTCPQTASITQDIYSRALYLRGNLYTPPAGVFTGYGFAGRALVSNYNHEHGNYNGTETVDFKVNFTNMAWMYGIGAQAAISQALALRIEYTRIPSATAEEHTLVRNVDFTSINLLWSIR